MLSAELYDETRHLGKGRLHRAAVLFVVQIVSGGRKKEIGMPFNRHLGAVRRTPTSGLGVYT